ncbi:hypothetical protein lerEdw1_016148 [Lerista edwardsae]|nr:hypothetical protein lerEdw1_016148 [Lerista edwardsae]
MKVKWMMYWIVFAFFTTAETLTDIILSWFPFYFELKIAFVIWLLSPYTKGSSVLYRKFVHPTLSNKEKRSGSESAIVHRRRQSLPLTSRPLAPQVLLLGIAGKQWLLRQAGLAAAPHHQQYTQCLEIDEYISQARDKSYETMMRVGKRGLNLAANAAVTAAAKGVLSEKLRSFSMQDLTLIRDDDTVHLRSHESRMHTSATGLLETVDDSGEEVSVSQRHGTQSDARTDPSDDDTGDKVPKRTQSLKAPKKATKTEPPQKIVKARPKKKATGSSAANESA